MFIVFEVSNPFHLRPIFRKSKQSVNFIWAWFMVKFFWNFSFSQTQLSYAETLKEISRLNTEVYRLQIELMESQKIQNRVNEGYGRALGDE